MKKIKELQQRLSEDPGNKDLESRFHAIADSHDRVRSNLDRADLIVEPAFDRELLLKNPKQYAEAVYFSIGFQDRIVEFWEGLLEEGDESKKLENQRALQTLIAKFQLDLTDEQENQFNYEAGNLGDLAPDGRSRGDISLSPIVQFVVEDRYNLFSPKDRWQWIVDTKLIESYLNRNRRSIIGADLKLFRSLLGQACREFPEEAPTSYQDVIQLARNQDLRELAGYQDYLALEIQYLSFSTLISYSEVQALSEIIDFSEYHQLRRNLRDAIPERISLNGTLENQVRQWKAAHDFDLIPNRTEGYQTLDKLLDQIAAVPDPRNQMLLTEILLMRPSADTAMLNYIADPDLRKTDN